MMNIQGFLNDKELFSVRSMSKGLELLPFRAGLLGRLGWFQEQAIPNSLAILDRQFINIQLLSPHPRGGATHAFDKVRREGIPVNIPQYDTVAEVSNADIVNLRKFDGGGYVLEDLQTLIMHTSKNQIDAALEPTLEYARITALGGKTCKGDGSVAINWDTLIGKPRPTETLEENFNEDVMNRWLDIIQDAAGGMPYDEIVALCGTDVWAMLLLNENFRQSRNAWQTGQGQRTAYWEQFPETTQIVWSGIRFIKYPAFTFGKDKAGKRLAFPNNKAYVFPVGIPGKFMTMYGIGDFNELRPSDVGLKYYAKLESNDFDRGMKIYLQSNTLIYDAFPETTLEVTAVAN